jgi:hypothetical protein
MRITRSSFLAFLATFPVAYAARQQKRNALAKFMSSNEWKNPRVTDMTRWLASQISFKEFFSRQIQ